jgi:L-ascorbate metabolism protein UlaG (beta-lactamase superfamily)
LLAPGCHHQYLEPRLFAQVRKNLPEAPSADTLEVRFLSVQGFAIRWRSTVVMTPPLYSNPPLEAVLAGNADLPPKDALVRSQLRPEWVKDAAAILVGHSHYDHLMDPYITKEYATEATIYGSTTAANLLEASGVPRSRITALVPMATTPSTTARAPRRRGRLCIQGRKKAAG